jgi:LDH2 family malate/lactate/ureidoglycolate dehydrogenase
VADYRTVKADSLINVVRGIVKAGGSTDREADLVATNLVEANKIAQGKTRVAYNKGEQLAPNIIIDDHGNPATDPRFAVIEPSGAILPFGEHKGSGLALICELLGGALSGGKTLSDKTLSDKTWSGKTWSGKSDGSRKVLNGMFSILIESQQNGHRRKPSVANARAAMWLAWPI